LHAEVWNELGQESSICGVFVQEQLSSEHQDDTF
jgi:hypothetical protein